MCSKVFSLRSPLRDSTTAPILRIGRVGGGQSSTAILVMMIMMIEPRSSRDRNYPEGGTD